MDGFLSQRPAVFSTSSSSCIVAGFCVKSAKALQTRKEELNCSRLTWICLKLSKFIIL